MTTTYGGWIEVWQIMMKHAKARPSAPEVTNPPDIYAMTYAEHDIFYFPASAYEIAEDSEDGRRLIALGCHVEDETWAAYT